MQIDAKVEPFAQTLVDKMKSENSRLVVILLGSGVCKKASAYTFGIVITFKFTTGLVCCSQREVFGTAPRGRSVEEHRL